jgi:tetratricopeptide (TPR) repeat protein
MTLTQRIAVVLMTLALAAMAMMSTSVRADETIRARGWVHEKEGFGRLVFDWSAPVRFSARIEGRQLVVEFDRPASFTTDRALSQLSPYIAGIAEQSDRRIAFNLTGDWTLKSFKDGTKVALDLYGTPPMLAKASPPTPASPPPAAAATPPPAPAATVASQAPPASAASPPAPAAPPPAPTTAAAQPPASAAKALTSNAPSSNATVPAPVVKLRFGQHDGFTRLVLDFPAAVPYRVDRQGDEARLVIDAPARLALDGTVRSWPAPIKDLHADGSESKPVLALSLMPGTAIKDFRDGPRLVLDLAPATGQAAAAASSSSTPAAPSSAAPSSPAAPTAAAPATADGAPGASDAGKPKPLLPAHAMTAADLLNGASTTVPAASIAPAAPSRDVPKIDATPVDPNAPLLTVALDSSGDGPSLRFPWTDPTGLAVFRRSGALWLVFDKPARFDLSALATPGMAAFEELAQVPGTQAALRLVGASGLAALPRRDGSAWIVDLRPQAEGAATPIALIPDASAVPPRLLLRLVSAGEPMSIKDPEVGDRLTVVTSAEPGLGVVPAQGWPGFKLLATVQGIAVEPHQDGLQVTKTADGIAIATGTDPNLAPVASSVKPAEAGADAATTDTAEADGPAATDRLFDLPAWRREDEGDFATVEAKLKAAIEAAPDSSREMARLDLARFYFAHGRAAETGGLIDLIAGERSDPLLDPQPLLMRAASAFLTGDPVVAGAALDQPALDGEIEADPWRGALAALKGDWAKAAADFQQAGPLVGDYPQAVRFQLGALAAETAIQTQDSVGAHDWLDKLKADQPTPAQGAKIAFLEGMLARSEGQASAAHEFWDKIGPEADADTAARTEFAKVDLDAETHAITDAEAIKRLEVLRFAARGSLMEFPLLKRLGQIYLAAGKPRQGLEILRQLASHFPQHRDLNKVMAAMTKGFRDAFLGETAKKLTPLEAISLYGQFSELTPPGAEGGEIAMALADRMIDMDLLDRADAVLLDQVRHKLTGADKARVGAKLAEVRLLDDNPDGALAALKESGGPNLPEDLAADRRRVEAQALHRAGRSLEALALLADDQDPSAGKLKARIYWELKEWAEAAREFDRLLAGADAQKLTPDQAEWGVAEAIALALAGDKFKLAELRQKLGAAMKETAQAAAFAMLTDPESDPESRLAQKLAGVARFESFMSDYKAKLSAAAPSTSQAPSGAPATTNAGG